MRAKIVVGLGFGDEGKGITTDWLCNRKSILTETIVVRFNGGQQAAHNVTANGMSHTFASYGSGTLRGVPTYISEHCTFYPPNIMREKEVLTRLEVHPLLFIHPLAMVTTPWDLAYNRVMARRTGHGSCGLGISATMERNKTPYKMYAVDLLSGTMMNERLKQIATYYSGKLDGAGYAEAEEIVKNEKASYVGALYEMDWLIKPYSFLTRYRDIVFEGAQGILLDMDHGTFPYVTYSNTTSKNAVNICKHLGITSIDIYYVTRCYQTRHGAGPISPLSVKVDLSTEKNITNDWQGEFRVAELDFQALRYALSVDDIYSDGHNKHLVVTCLDQRKNYKFPYYVLGRDFVTVHESWSPDSKDIKIRENTHVVYS